MTDGAKIHCCRLSVAANMQELQHLGHHDPFSTQVGQRVEKFCANICRALQQEGLSPEERQKAEARRVAEASAIAKKQKSNSVQTRKNVEGRLRRRSVGATRTNVTDEKPKTGAD